MLLLAKDGVYLPTAPRPITQGILTSGNRADILINCPAGENFTFNSTALELPKDSVQRVKDGGDAVIEAVLLKINAVASPWVSHLNPQCDLPVFEVNRPCCDWPPFKPRTHNDLPSPNPVFASCSGRPRQPARAGGGKRPDVCDVRTSRN